MAKIAPSMLASDFGRFAEQAQAAVDAGAEYLHLDIMDGCFVPNISFGAGVVEAVRRACPSALLDVHMMVNDPLRYAEDFIRAGANIVTLHEECTPHLQRALAFLRQKGVKAGVALNPATGLETLRYVLDDIDLLLVMTVNPGFGGQKLIPATVKKIREARELIGERDILLEVDGGVSPATGPMLIQAGAQLLVAGSAVFGAQDMAAAMRAILGE